MVRKLTNLTGLLFLLAVLAGLGGCSAESRAAGAPEKREARETAPAVKVVILPDRIAEHLNRMSDAQKVGQLFFARCPESGGAAMVERYQPAGLILFGQNLEGETPRSLRETLAGCQSVSALPLLIGVDEEGGTVTRVSSRTAFREERFRSPQAVYAAGGWEEIARDTSEKDNFLLSLGINVNLAPVVDVSTDPADFMYARSFGQSAAETAQFASAVVRQMDEDGIGSVLKHFPGYGNNADTHTGIAYDDRPIETFRESDLLPFSAAIQAGAGAVLVAHNVVRCMDAEYPASLSAAVHKLLREELGFDGVAMTDDLAMEAIGQFADGESAAVLAVLAGNDLLISSDLPTQYAAVLAAVEEGFIPEERLDDAVYRVLRWKRRLGIWKP